MVGLIATRIASIFPFQLSPD